MTDVLVIGSGPAGLSAAVYTRRAGLSTTVLEGETQGGLVSTTDRIDNYLGLPDTGGMEMAEVFRQHAATLGAELVSDEALSVVKTGDQAFETTTSTGVIHSRAVIFAGGSKPRKLGVEGEDLSGVSYCAICDGMFFADQPVVVVGGGETAVEEAMFMAQLSTSVDILVRGDTWKASEPAVQKLKDNPKITVHMETSITAINGEDMVESVHLNTGEQLDVSGVFIAVGQTPSSTVAAPHCSLFEDGFINHSDTDGFFVTGDVSNPDYRQIAIAVGDGARVGIDTAKYLL